MFATLPAMASLGTYQTSLFGQGDPAVLGAATVHRHWLDDTSWVDISRSWLVGADELLARFAATIAWEAGRRPMYGRLVAGKCTTISCGTTVRR